MRRTSATCLRTFLDSAFWGSNVKRIAFDYTNLMADVVGEAGIDEAALAAIRPGVQAAVGDLLDLARDEETRFVNLPDADITGLLEAASRIREGIDDFVVLGIGGSSLGSRAIYRALVRPFTGKLRNGSPRVGPRMHVVENVDPVTLADLLESLDLERTAFNVVTKSGNTIETMSAFFIVRDRLIERFGIEGYRRRMFATTDPSRGALRSVVREDGLTSFDVPPGVGGRFSVLSAVGLLPLAVAGLDVTALLRGAREARDHAYEDDLERNMAAMFAATQVLLYNRGIHDVVLMPYSDALTDTSAWFVQLWAESLGKPTAGTVRSAVGPTPIAALGTNDQHSQLQLFMEGPANKNLVFLELKDDPTGQSAPATRAVCSSLGHLGGHQLAEIQRAELEGVRAGLAEVHRPTSTFVFDALTAETLGAFLMTMEAATSFAGSLFGVDPFDQPGVELAKRYAHGLLGRDQEAHYAEKLRAGLAARRSRSISL